MHRFLFGVSALALPLLAAVPARAGFVTGTISGQVTAAGSGIAGVSTCDLVTGSYAYNAGLTLDSAVGPVNPLTAFSLSIGTNPKVFSLADLENAGLVVPGRSVDSSTPAADSLYFLFDEAVISDFAGAFVPAQQIFPQPPQTFFVDSDTEHSFTFAFAATPAAAVPEPASFGLLALGLVGLGLRHGWQLSAAGSVRRQRAT
jgi:hypothetical protein